MKKAPGWRAPFSNGGGSQLVVELTRVERRFMHSYTHRIQRIFVTMSRLGDARATRP